MFIFSRHVETRNLLKGTKIRGGGGGVTKRRKFCSLFEVSLGLSNVGSW